MHTHFISENQEQKDHMGDSDIDGEILEWISNKIICLGVETAYRDGVLQTQYASWNTRTAVCRPFHTQVVQSVHMHLPTFTPLAEASSCSSALRACRYLVLGGQLVNSVRCLL
jgi:hypothetical protein